MGSLRLSVHPLFFIFGLYNAITGQIFTFIIYTVTAVVHELGHSFVASSAGYRLDKITLMPYGAVVSGQIEGLNFSDELKIALAGPLINIGVGLFFVASWWMFPETYAFTDIVASANFSMAIINLLPVFPLDGGRVLMASLAQRIGGKKASKICTVTGIIVAVILIALFVISTVKGSLNVSLLFFSLFVLFGVIGKAKNNKYVRICSLPSKDKLKHGMPYKKQAIEKSVTVKKMMSLLEKDCINEIAVFDGNKELTVLNQTRINKIIENGDIYSPLEKYV
jgi:stage IV sporulation protein FB